MTNGPPRSPGRWREAPEGPPNESHPARVVQVVNKQTTLDPKILQALSRGGTIDITTVGRQSGQPRRIEIVFHNIEGRIYISGMPGFPRGWLANLDAHPGFTFHMKGAVRTDLLATARIIRDEAERRTILPHIARAWKRKDLETMVLQSPLIEVTLDGVPAAVEAP
jgi:deazaflavin-dependent oxidoreductase (nitroreductase family)